ncbi:MAG: TIGR03663 family protein [Albidovulum sp.]|nr:TIGR03663 family protein [Albidovulum sp.]
MKHPIKNREADDASPESHWIDNEEAILLSPYGRSEIIAKFLYPGAWAALILIAGVLRFWDLGARTMHDGEAKFAKIAWDALEGGSIAFDASVHGLLQLPAAAALFFLLGDSETTARLISAAAGTAMVAMPYLLRSRLGETGAYFTAAMLAVSPSLLYFSRFAGSDILVAAFSLGIAIAVWRHFENFEKTAAGERGIASSFREANLYAVSAMLALAIASKETALVFPLVLGAYLALTAVCQILSAARERMNSESELNGGGSSIYRFLAAGLKFREVSKEVSMLAFLATTTVSLAAASFGILQVAQMDFGAEPALSGAGAGGPLPGVGAAVAAACVFVLAVGYGLRWNWKAWLISAAILYILYFILVPGLLGFLGGFHSGILTLIGYWLDPQGAPGGEQPWFYFILLSLAYEYLPFCLSIAATVYYIRRPDAFALFLAFWSWAAILAFSLSAEKFPWLTVYIALPLILLSGKFLNDVVERCGFRHPATIALMMICALLFALTARTAHQASFKFGDIPVEMLVQKQSGLGLQALAKATRKTDGLFVAVDGTDGFHWPWSWYLRGMSDALFVYCGAGKDLLPTNVDVVFVNENVAIETSEAGFGKSYEQELVLPHRSWFPESVYKGKALGELAASLSDEGTWRSLADYFLNRSIRTESGICLPSEGIYTCLGSEYTAVYNKIETGDHRIPCSF